KYLPWLGFGSGDEPAETTTAAADAAPVSNEPATESSETVTLTTADAAPATRYESRAAAQDLPVAAPSTVRTTRTPVQQFGSRPTAEELAARAPRNLDAPQAAPVAAPVAAQTASADVYVDVPTQPQTAAEVVNVTAEAEVAEAVQVPVSSFDAPPAVAVANRPVGYGGFPSQAAVTKAGESWVQLGYFTSKEAAFAFSRDISRKHPDLLQLVRIRIVNPYEGGRPASARSGEHTSMRMGPFKDQSTINRVCAIAKENKLTCSLVNEVGTSGARASATAGRSRYNPAESASRREAVNRGYSRTAGAQPAGAYWVQLGAFDSTAAAQQRWVELQKSNNDKLGRLAPQVSYPALSSSTAPVYHLRTGPFVNKVGALDLCDTLRTRAVNCVVVQAR
ncbi:MAG: SPOR domain-containing protein, partial [Alphaproteobacteria bacterium]|nr:SPOR domain-containing protein [Alphaproteobacteria bacterium]